jgi:hypothetical protein
MARNTHLLLALSALAMLAGCSNADSGGVDETGASVGALDLGPTVVVPRSVWEPLPAGCDGRLPMGGVTITGADGAPGLRVAMDGDGETAICADSAAGLLDSLNLADLVPVRSGVTAPIHAVPSWILSRRDSAAGDPSPQPSAPVSLRAAPIDQGGDAEEGGPTDGDPSPQPSQPNGSNANTKNGSSSNTMMNGSPNEGDPSPQPSQPRDITHVMM